MLYAMIPKAVADRLRKGITALETCQVRGSAVNDSGTNITSNVHNVTCSLVGGVLAMQQCSQLGSG